MDLINRQDAIDAMYKIVEQDLDSSVFEDDLAENPHIDVIVDELENLPSAEPEHKAGKWIPKDDARYYCSSCDGIAPKGCKWNYCPNCGADMRGEQE